MKKILKQSIILLIYLGFSAGNSNATLIGDIELRDGNSTASFLSHLHRSGAEINGSWRHWATDNVDNLWVNWTYVGVKGVPGRTPLVTWNVDDFSQQDTNSDGDIDTFFIQRSNDNDLQASSSYTLRGGLPGSNQSHVNLSTTLTNHSSNDVELELFQWIDFDLGAEFSDEYSELTTPSVVTQWDGVNAVSLTTDSELTHWFLGGGHPGHILHHGDPMPDHMNYGPGDAKWLLQWDISLSANGGSFQFNQTLDASPSTRPVPAPSTLLLLMSSIAFFYKPVNKRQFSFRNKK